MNHHPIPVYTLTLNPTLDRTLTVKEFVFDEMVRATSSQLDPSGKGFNVSRALKVLGSESIALGFLGGFTGQMIEQMLVNEGLTLDPVWVNGETRTATMVFCGERYLKVNEAGPLISAERLAEMEAKIHHYLAPDQWWVLSGSLPPGAPIDIYAQLTSLLKAGGARVLLDASGESLRRGLAAQPDLVKPNTVEAADLVGHPVETEADFQEAADAFLATGAKIVALSLGADGLLLATANERYRLRPPAVNALNPIGAGDGLVGGLLYALVQGMPLERVARWGVANGTGAAMQAGTTYSSKEVVTELVDRCVMVK